MNILFEKSLAFTGHRPHKLDSYNPRTKRNLKMLLKLRALIERHIVRRGVNTFISGMAIGIDMWSAQIILALREKKYPHIKLVCAIPCAEQYKKWSEEDKEAYHEILSKADEVYYVSDKPYTPWCMTDRDKWMVDNAKYCIAVWNDEKDGGTWQTVKYAIKRQRVIVKMHPHTLEINLVNVLDKSKN